jgi:hypothetical protein
MPYAAIWRYDVSSHGNPNFPQQQKLLTYKPILYIGLAALPKLGTVDE